MMRARPTPRLAEAVGAVPAPRGRAGRRLIVSRAGRRAHAVAFRVCIAGSLFERAVRLGGEGESREVAIEPVDRRLTPAVFAGNDMDGRLGGESRNRARVGVRFGTKGDRRRGVSGIWEIALSGECRGGEAQGEDCRVESAHARTLLSGKGGSDETTALLVGWRVALGL